MVCYSFNQQLKCVLLTLFCTAFPQKIVLILPKLKMLQWKNKIIIYQHCAWLLHASIIWLILITFWCSSFTERSSYSLAGLMLRCFCASLIWLIFILFSGSSCNEKNHSLFQTIWLDITCFLDDLLLGCYVL